MKTINILFVGDIIGSTGLRIFAQKLPALREKFNVDSVIVNGENIAKNGRGIVPQDMEELKQLGVNVVTSGNHVWAKNSIHSYLENNTDLLRPANYPSQCPGKGVNIFSVRNVPIAVISLQGRVFIKDLTECPFRTMQTLLTYVQSQTNVVLVDFHAEATAEKQGLAFFLDGKVSAVVGTHTHVQTADERILPGGTAFISDVGMVGSLNSMIGFKKESALRTMITQMPSRFEVEDEPPFVLGGVVITVDIQTGKAHEIKRIRLVDKSL